MDHDKLLKKGPASCIGGKGSARRKKAGNREINRDEQKFEETFGNFYRSITWRQVDGVNNAIFMVGIKIMMFATPLVAACKTQNIWVIRGKPIIHDVRNLYTSFISLRAAQTDDMQQISNESGDDVGRCLCEEGSGAEAEDNLPSTSYS